MVILLLEKLLLSTTIGNTVNGNGENLSAILCRWKSETTSRLFNAHNVSICRSEEQLWNMDSKS